MESGMERRVRDLLGEFEVEREGADRMGLVAQLAVRVVLAEQEMERRAGELTVAISNGVDAAKRGDLRTMTRGDLMAAVTDKAAVYDAALMKVAERREVLAMTAEKVRAERAPELLVQLAEGDAVSWTWDGAAHTGKVDLVKGGKAVVLDPEGARWYLPTGELTKVEPASPLDHVDCAGFDQQVNHWHCHTHELFEQPW
jgi:hypothetical protein